MIGIAGYSYPFNYKIFGNAFFAPFCEEEMSKRNIIALCDTTADYCFRLDEYLRRNLKLPFKIVDFTSQDDLMAADSDLKSRTIALVISQSVYEKVHDAGFDRLLVLE